MEQPRTLEASREKPAKAFDVAARDHRASERRLGRFAGLGQSARHQVHAQRQECRGVPGSEPRGGTGAARRVKRAAARGLMT